MKKFSTFGLLLAILWLTGCKSSLKDFNLDFTMESVNNYRLSIEIRNDGSYHIQQQNVLFDIYAKKEQINHSEGKLTDAEFNELIKLIADSRIFKMKNTYGFNEQKSYNDSDDPLRGLIYRLNYTEGNKSKYLLVHPNSNDPYSKHFSKLIGFLSNYASNHLKSDPLQ